MPGWGMVWMLETPALCSGYLAPLEKSSLIVLKLNGRQGLDMVPVVSVTCRPMARVVSWCSLQLTLWQTCK